MPHRNSELPVLDPGPFRLCSPGTRPPRLRGLDSLAGLGDRMRTAAFAEWQAIAAFSWAAEFFGDVPADLRRDWKEQVKDEARHYQLIKTRMAQLDLALDERPVSGALWDSLVACTSGRDFCLRIAGAEERGRQAAIKLSGWLQERDPATAAVFREIAQDEVAHVSLARTYFDWTPTE